MSKLKSVKFNGAVVKVFEAGYLLGTYSYLIPRRATVSDSRTKQWVSAASCTVVE